MNITATGLSIGTHLAMETISTISPVDAARSRPVLDRPISAYTHLYVNVLTLIRNIVTTYPSGARVSVTDVTAQVLSELVILPSISPIPVVPYMSTYALLSGGKLAPYTRQYTTPLQKERAALYGTVLNTVMARQSDIQRFTWTPSGSGETLMLTHLVADLLGYRTFPSLSLLESNTGTIKHPPLFSTKFNLVNVYAAAHMPFSMKSWLVMGDKTLMKSAPTGVRKQYMAACEDNHWSPITADSKVLNDLKKPPYELAYAFYKQLPSI